MNDAGREGGEERRRTTVTRHLRPANEQSRKTGTGGSQPRTAALLQTWLWRRWDLDAGASPPLNVADGRPAAANHNACKLWCFTESASTTEDT